MRWHCEGSLLDEALLILVLGVDRGQRLVGLVAAAHEESSGREGGGEGGDRKLLSLKSAYAHLACLELGTANCDCWGQARRAIEEGTNVLEARRLRLLRIACLSPPQVGVSSQSFYAGAIASTRDFQDRDSNFSSTATWGAGRRTTCDPTWRPAIVYIATILAVGIGRSG